MPLLLASPLTAALVVALAAASPEIRPEPAPEPVVDPEAAESLTWEQLVAEVERTSPLMSAARAGLETFETKLSRAEWAYFPTFKFEIGAFPTPKVDGLDFDFTRWGYYYRVRGSFVQPVYTFGRIAALKEAADHGIDVGEAQVAAARWELRHRAAQAWHGALLARELRALFDDGKGWLDKAEARMERLRDEDSDEYDQLEHLRFKARVAEFFQLETENRLLEVTTGEGLRLLLSRPSGARVQPPPGRLEQIVVTPLPVEEYLRVARREQPRLRMARAGTRAREALADAKLAELWPVLVLAGEIGYSDSDVIDDQSTVLGKEVLGPTGGIVLGLSWKLDVPQQVLQADEARAAARKAASEARVAQDLMELEVRRLHQQLVDKQLLIEQFQRSTKAAQGWLNATWDLYDTGFGTFKDVMDALVQFYGKKVGYLRMVHEHNVLVHDLSRAIGHDVLALPPQAAPGADPAAAEETP